MGLLCNPMDCSPPGSSVHGISQARMLEWVAVSFSRGSSKLRGQTRISYIAGGFFTTEPPGKSSTFEYFLWKENWLIYLSRWVNTWLELLFAPWKQCNFLQRIYIWNEPSLSYWIINRALKSRQDFSGGPVAKTPCSQCRGPKFYPWSEA